ncbi:hypothetical protein EDB19DRAFT_1834448 [Suillus lakei]|nr:hypothetical protein EDB19DRAFT_1834448 [Suillus lakei]
MAVDNVSNAHEQGEPEDESYYDFGSQGEDLDSGGGTRNEDSEAKVTDHFLEPPLAFDEGYTFLRLFDADKNSIYRKMNLYYPFSGRREWQLATWILHSSLSMEKINSFLALEMQESYEVELNRCLAVHVGSHKLFQHHIPQSLRLFSTGGICLNVYSTAQKLSQIYTDWMTGDHAWEMQVHNMALLKSSSHVFFKSVLLRGATLLGTILFSDKTCITALSGDCVAHPLLISLANIHMATWLKSSSNAFLLTALLPVTKFVHKNKQMKGMLQDWLIHHCLNIILQPLKLAAQSGVMLSDPIGRSCYCFTLLASYIADTPEAMMLACISGKTSPITMAMYKQFGDTFQHEPQTRSKTLEQLEIVCSCTHPDDLEEFFREAQKFCLNGVDKPFWWDWLLVEPSWFFTPESLHHIHKKFWDHDAQWIILTVGGSVDFRFSIIQPTTGYRHFYSGISKLKQVTGHCHRDVQRSIIAVSADAAPPGVIVAVCALMHFNYLVQSPCIDDKDLGRIAAALDEFHANKQSIIAAGVCQGKGGKTIDNWQIPKLELMQSIVTSIRNSGVIAQWSADVTEHAHVTEVKDPARSSNNNNYDLQICHYLDRANKCNQFDLATSLLDHCDDPGVVGEESAEEDDKLDDDANGFPAELLSSSRSPGQPRPITDYFSITKILQAKKVGSVPFPLCSFVVGRTALNLAYDPSIKHATVDEIAIMFGLPDLRPAIANFLHHKATYGNHIHSIGGPRRAAHGAELPFDKVQVWFKIHLQETEFHDPRNIRRTQTLNCTPPSDPWTLDQLWSFLACQQPFRALHCANQAHHSASWQKRAQWAWDNQYLTYVQQFDISSERDPTTQLHTLKRVKRSDGTWMGDIIPVSQLRAPVHLVPHFGATADMCLMAYNSMEHTREFWLNYFWDKHSFFALSE